jgi:hypothetical protein
MKAHTQSGSTAEHAGAVIGRAWLRWLRQEHRLIVWLVSKGLPATAVKTLLRIVTLAVLCALIYTALWLAVLLLVFTTVGSWYACDSDLSNESDASALGEQVDHRKSVFYDPVNHNDDPDPRFEGE